jgi:hypothetical protein
MKSATQQSVFPKIFLAGICLLILGLVSICGYFIVFRAIDEAVCIPNVAKKIGVDPNENEIQQYLKKQIIPV